MAFQSYPGGTPHYGYSCQTWLARCVNRLLHPSHFYCWFSRRFNAFDNGDDSNPLLLYLVIDRAVQQKATNNAKIKDVRLNLMRAVSKELRSAGRHGEVAEALGSLSVAGIEMFAAEVWRIDLRTIAGRYKPGRYYPDEYEIADLQASEFEVIID